LDRRGVGILAQHEKYRPWKLYFDQKTSLLVKCRHQIKDFPTGLDHDEELVHSDFHSVRGTKQPFRIEVSWKGEKGAPTWFQLSEMKLFDKPLDEKVFSKP
jgi:hypothetical protein